MWVRFSFLDRPKLTPGTDRTLVAPSNLITRYITGGIQVDTPHLLDDIGWWFILKMTDLIIMEHLLEPMFFFAHDLGNHWNGTPSQNEDFGEFQVNLT